MLTLISHTYNEGSLLLPYWIKWHLPLVDHAVIIDYDSTDNSRELVQELAPHWEFRTSKNREFDSDRCDQEVMEVEAEISGWKMALNQTEFLFHPDPKGYLSNREETRPDLLAVGAKGIVMVDPPQRKYEPSYREGQLPLQRHYGYFDEDYSVRHPRYAHRASCGLYTPGRHTTMLPHENVNDFFILWFALAPYGEILPRRMQIKEKMSQRDIDRGRGHHHLMTFQQLEDHYELEYAKSSSLLEDPRYSSVRDAFLSPSSKRRYPNLPKIELVCIDS